MSFFENQFVNQSAESNFETQNSINFDDIGMQHHQFHENNGIVGMQSNNIHDSDICQVQMQSNILNNSDNSNEKNNCDININNNESNEIINNTESNVMNISENLNNDMCMSPVSGESSFQSAEETVGTDSGDGEEQRGASPMNETVVRGEGLYTRLLVVCASNLFVVLEIINR